MGFLDSVLTFIDGVKSVVIDSGAIQSTVSDGVSNGIEHAFMRIKKPLERSLIRVSFVALSAFLIVFGVAILLDNFMPYRGLGFVLAGALFGIIVLFFLSEKGTGG